MPPRRRVPGAYDFARAAWFQGIGATGKALGKVTVTAPAREQGWRARVAGWRQRLADHVRASLSGSEGGVAAALATGDQGGIGEADAEAMRRSGLAHLLSVSGLHLTAVVGAVMLLTLKLLALSPTLALRFRLVVIAAGAGALAGVAYTLLTGSEVPTVRACIAALLILAGIAIGREGLTLRLVRSGRWSSRPLARNPPETASSSLRLDPASACCTTTGIRALAPPDEGGREVARVLLGPHRSRSERRWRGALYHFHRTGSTAPPTASPAPHNLVIMPLERSLCVRPDLPGRSFWAAEQPALLRSSRGRGGGAGAVASPSIRAASA